ncbi:hypothetical protein O6H91_03G104900 [Diphasiastrum complanatum]|uniref:Uncharacterized protein n=1 Tax=Diphasiastrum complanatum TaxID=34168 RepID=A0ACC2E9N9_DIPCM|nr:hypothetical protein O6H91_03G104900 [Diphasiastrum complanatum]
MAAAASLPISKRPVDVLLVAFFVINVPILLLIDAQVVLPPSLFPHFLRSLVKWHVQSSGDFLVGDKPSFFRGLVLCEIVVALPLLLSNAYAFYYGKQWGRMSGIIYGVYTAATMVPILSEIYYALIPGKSKLYICYVPYLVIPIFVIIRLLPLTNPFSEPFPFRKRRIFKLQ